jgi:hypothetical protein
MVEWCEVLCSRERPGRLSQTLGSVSANIPPTVICQGRLLELLLEVQPFFLSKRPIENCLRLEARVGIDRVSPSTSHSKSIVYGIADYLTINELCRLSTVIRTYLFVSVFARLNPSVLALLLALFPVAYRGRSFVAPRDFLQNVSRWQQVNTFCKISWLDFASVEWHLFRLHNEAKFTTIRRRNK